MKKISLKLNNLKYLGNRRYRPVILALLFTLAFCVFVTATLFASSSYVPEDNVQELNYERSQVYVDGTGYELDNYTKKQHKEEEEKREIIMEEEPKKQDEEPERPDTTPPSYTRRYSGSSSSFSRPSYSRPSYNTNPSTKKPAAKKKKTEKKKTKKKESQSDYDKKKQEANVKPTIKISGVTSGETVKGETKKFKVTATSYDGDDITGSKLTVKMNGVKLTPSGNSYVGDVVDGDNSISVKAVDGEGNSSSKTVKFKGIVDAEPEVIGDLNISVTVDVLGLGTILDERSVDIYENEALSEVVKRYFSEESDATAVDIGSGYYELGRIKKKGIIDDIPEDIIEDLEEKGIPIPDDKDSLGLNDFGPGSGWMYRVDGSAPDEYMSSVDPKDGSNIEIYYTISGME